MENKNVHVASSSQSFEYTKTSGHDLDFALQNFTQNREIIIPKLYFQEDKANILTESYEELDRLANIFKQNSHCYILLKGHVDVAIKTEIANKLSQLRVNAVKDYLLSKGVNPAQLSINAMGRSNPLIRNPLTDEERRMNNRVTYTVTKIDAIKELEYSLPPSSSANLAGGQTQTGGSQQQPAGNQSSTYSPPRQQPQTTYPPQQQQSQQQLQTQQTQTQQQPAGSANLPFIVQVSSSGVLDMKNPNFAKIRTQLGYEVKYVLASDGKYKYFIGGFETITEAKDVVEKLKNIGIKDGWARSKY